MSPSATRPHVAKPTRNADRPFARRSGSARGCGERLAMRDFAATSTSSGRTSFVGVSAYALMMIAAVALFEIIDRAGGGLQAADAPGVSSATPPAVNHAS